MVIAILTDGLENSATRNFWKQVAAKIRNLTGKCGWDLVFPGTNQEAIANAANLSIAANNPSGFVSDQRELRATLNAMSLKSIGFRAKTRISDVVAAMQPDVALLFRERGVITFLLNLKAFLHSNRAVQKQPISQLVHFKRFETFAKIYLTVILNFETLVSCQRVRT